MRIKHPLLTLLLLSPVAGCDRKIQVAAGPGIGAEEIVAAFADAYGAELPIAIYEGTWDYIADRDLGAAMKRYAENAYVKRRRPPREGPPARGGWPLRVPWGEGSGLGLGAL